MKLPTLLSVVFLCLSCTQQPKGSLFEHDITVGPTPWTRAISEPGDSNFTFAIISDLNGGERPGVYSTAVDQINRLNPAFVLSVGDLIDGGTEDPEQLSREWDSFDSRTSKLKMPFFYLGGNHDLTNLKMREVWEKRIGPRYYYFLYKDVLFLMLDSEDYTEQRMQEIYNARARALKVIDGEAEGEYEDTEYYHMPERTYGAMGDAQLSYFKTVLEQYPRVRWTFILMHKPLWMGEGGQGLAGLEAALANRPYTVFNGHLHSLSYQIRKEREYIMLGTTGGSQNKADSMAFDHITLIRMGDTPVITHLKMDGILNEKGRVPK